MKVLRRDHPEPPAVEGARWVQLGHARFALVDADDFARVTPSLWSYYTVGYAARSAGGRKNKHVIYLHRFLVGAGDGEEVDHKNGNKLDYRRDNLRVTNRTGNTANRIGVIAGSGFRGVYPCRKSWHAGIKGKHLGAFATQEEAARAYDKAARVIFGGMSRLNFPGPNELPARTLTVAVSETDPTSGAC